MSVLAKNLVSSQVTDALVTYYTAPAKGKTRMIIDKFTATNDDGSARTVDIHIVPKGGTAVDANRIVKAESINAGITKDFTELQNQILNTGDFIAIIASLTLVVYVRISGREVTRGLI